MSLEMFETIVDGCLATITTLDSIPTNHNNPADHIGLTEDAFKVDLTKRCRCEVKPINI